MKNFLLILTCVALGVAGQLLLKHGMSSTGERVDEVRDVVPRLLLAASNPAVITGFFFYALSAALWLVVLTRVELSLASLSLILSVITAIQSRPIRPRSSSPGCTPRTRTPQSWPR